MMLKSHHFLAICVFALVLTMAACGKMPSSTAADDPRTEALSAYRAILEAAPAVEGEHKELTDASFGYEENLRKFGKHYDYFALFDLNGDDVPELIAMSVVNFRWTPISVFRFADGKALPVKDPQDEQSSVTFWQNSSANGAYTLYFCAEDHIHSLWRGDTPVGEMAEDRAYVLEGTHLTETECAVGENNHAVYFSDIAKANTAENRKAMLP